MELITIKTLNTLLLPYFLLTVYFCIGCCLIYALNSSNTQELKLTTLSPVGITSTSASSSNIESFPNQQSESLNFLSTLDIDHLPLRECRKVIRLINAHLPKQERIRQKINGKDAPVAWLRKQIKQHQQ